MSRTHRTIPSPASPLAAPLALVVACGCALGAGVPRVLIDKELSVKNVDLLRLDDGVIVYDDAAGLRRTERWDRYLGLLDALDAIERPDQPEVAGPGATGGADILARAFNRDVTIVTFDERWVLETVDGQRLLGSPEPGGDESLRWRLGDADTTGPRPVVSVPLEQIDRLAPLRFGLPDERADGDDVLRLVNGDSVSGFVESIADTVRIDSSIGPVEAPIGRVSLIDLANPPEPAEGIVIWLSDGSVTRAEQLRDGARPGMAHAVVIDRFTAPGSAAAEINPSESEGGAGPESTPLRELAGVAFDRGGYVPLSELEPESQRSLGDRRWFERADVGSGDWRPMGAGDVRLPGPMEVRWVLPTGASRLAFDAELPARARLWGDCELVVLLALTDGATPVELSRTALRGDAPEARVNVELAEPERARRRLIVRLEPGGYGTIQDEVLLRRPLIASPE